MKAYFVVNDTTIFLLATAIEERVAECWRPIFWRQIQSLKTQNSQTFPFGNLICFYSYKSRSVSSKKRCPTSRAFDIRLADMQNLLRFEGARPDHMRVKSPSCIFPRKLLNFVRPGELVSFDP